MEKYPFIVSVSVWNLAHQKPTWQSSTLGAHSSHRAVDGRKSDFSEAGNQCALSRDYKDTATWFVDLETIQNINQIKIYPRTEGRQWSKLNMFCRTEINGFNDILITRKQLSLRFFLQMPIISSLDDLQAIQFIYPIRQTEMMESFVIEIQTLTLYLFRLLQLFNVQFLADM